MALYLLPTANDTIGTVTGLTQSVTTAYTIPETLELKMTCTKDQIEIEGQFNLSYTATLGSTAIPYIDTTEIKIYRGTPSTGTQVYTTGAMVRTHYGSDGPKQSLIVPIRFIEYPAMLNTDDTARYYITVQSTATNTASTPVSVGTVNLTQYTVSAREIPYCDR